MFNSVPGSNPAPRAAARAAISGALVTRSITHSVRTGPTTNRHARMLLLWLNRTDRGAAERKVHVANHCRYGMGTRLVDVLKELSGNLGDDV